MQWRWVLSLVFIGAAAGCAGAGSGATSAGTSPTASATSATNAVQGVVVRSPTPSLPSASATTVTVANSNSSPAPQINGTPLQSILVGSRYDFLPVVSATASDATFAIRNCPSWASFNSATGELSGIPDASDVGTYSPITISLTDGLASATLTPFSITVAQTASGSAELSWVPPTQNTDGTVLSDLAGYTIHYGASLSSLTTSIDVADPNISSYMVDNLQKGTWYFVVMAYTSSKLESVASNAASKIVL